MADIGKLHAGRLPANAPPSLLGEIAYLGRNWLETTAGIVSILVTESQRKNIERTPIGVVASTPGAIRQMLREADDGFSDGADRVVFRLNPGEDADAMVYASVFGNPAPDRRISFAHDSRILAAQRGVGPIPGPVVIGEPQSALDFPKMAKTDSTGTARIRLQASDPGRPREYLDGQVYGVAYAAGDRPILDDGEWDSSRILNVLVWSRFEAPAHPSWIRDVRPIFEVYANLYPVMRSIVDMSSYASVMAKRHLLQLALALPVTDPNFMPITRDLSTAKRAMMVRSLDHPRYLRLDSPEDLKLAIQHAIELEHAVIPPYLCALFSLKPGTNGEIRRLLHSIVIDEMGHMAQAANLLIAIGGTPRIDHAGFVPRYPGPLPGGIRGELTVRLRKCSIAQIRDVFCSIEEPEWPREAGGFDDATEDHRYTIGWFYREIDRALENLAQRREISFGHVECQLVDWPGGGRLRPIQCLADARATIRRIQHQGEGRSPLDPSDEQEDLGHFYKLAEVVAGRRIVRTPSGLSYSGEVIPFDPDGVWPMIDDPEIAAFPAGSRARILAEQFAEIYQNMLRSLERAFSRDPAGFTASIGLMHALGLAARQLMQTPSGRDDGTTAGPVFEFVG